MPKPPCATRANRIGLNGFDVFYIFDALVKSHRSPALENVSHWRGDKPKDESFLTTC